MASGEGDGSSGRPTGLQKAAATGDGAPKLLDADELIDEILAKKGPAKYEEGLSEDKWEEELEKIPLFMTKPPSATDVSENPSLAALQELKYQTSSPEGRATAHKEDGNEEFRLSKYKSAIECYTAGLREKAQDRNLNAVLYSNRAAANYHLGNYRSSINDATQAKKLKPDHMKALLRGALACMKLERYGEVLEWCDEGLRVDPEHSKLKELRTKASKEKKRLDRDRRKQAMEDKVKLSEEQRLVEAIRSRGIKMVNEKGRPQTSVQDSSLSWSRVHLDEDGSLIWPVMFLYPEVGQSDLIAEFKENQRFEDHIVVMFGGSAAPWDRDHAYNPSSIEVYYEDIATGGVTAVPLDSTLAQIISLPKYKVVSGHPSFVVLAKGTAFREEFLKRTAS